jgi:hypothetical protein
MGGWRATGGFGKPLGLFGSDKVQRKLPQNLMGALEQEEKRERRESGEGKGKGKEMRGILKRMNLRNGSLAGEDKSSGIMSLSIAISTELLAREGHWSFCLGQGGAFVRHCSILKRKEGGRKFILRRTTKMLSSFSKVEQ